MAEGNDARRALVAGWPACLYCCANPLSNIANDLNGALLDRVAQSRVILFGKVCISIRELDHHFVKGLVFADVATDHHRRTRAGMRESERFSADSRESGQAFVTQFFDVDLTFAIPELADVEVDLLAILIVPARPTQKYVARCCYGWLSR